MENQEDREGIMLAIPVPELYEQAFRQVHVESQVVMLGPMTASITKITIGGQVTTPTSPATIGVGDYFDVEVQVVGDNPNMGLTDVWSICATMITTTGLLPNYDITISLPNQGSISVTMKLDAKGQPGPMPDSDITIRFKLFGFQGLKTTTPAQTLW